MLSLQFIRYEDSKNKLSIPPLVAIMICNCAKKKENKRNIAKNLGNLILSEGAR